MVVMVGGKVVPNGYNTLITTANEEDDDEETDEEVIESPAKQDKEFSKYIDNLPKEIQAEEGTPTKAAQKDPTANADDDDGGGKPAAKPKTQSPAQKRQRQTDEGKWNAQFDKLKKFKLLNGHCNVPYHRPPLLTSFMCWIASQRRYYKTGKMPQNRIEAMEAIGFQWSGKAKGRPSNKQSWEDRFDQLKAYKQHHGTLVIDRETLDENLLQLNQWCQTQRQSYHAAKLSAPKVQQMESIGFEWGEYIPQAKFKKEGEGGENGSKKRAAKDTEGKAAKKRKVSPPLPPDEVEWVEMCVKVQKLKQLNNDKLPTDFSNDIALDRWVQHQKQLLSKEELHRSRMVRLHQLGFELPAGVTVATYQNKSPTKPSSKKSLPLALKTSPLKKSAKPAVPKPFVPTTRPGGTLGMNPWNPYMPYNPYAAAANPYAAAQKPPAAAQTPQMQAMKAENAQLQSENEQLSNLHHSMMMSLEEEKTLRRQNKRELESKMEQHAATIARQGTTLQKQGQQLAQLAKELKQVLARATKQEEKEQELKRQREQDELRQADLQRQRERQALQLQQEQQERAAAEQRRQEQQLRQQIGNSLYNLPSHY